jgi:hypothetical protein
MALTDFGLSRRIFKLRDIAPSLSTRLAVWRSRRALARLDRRMLDDIGVSAEQARNEVDLSLWDVPETWRNR